MTTTTPLDAGRKYLAEHTGDQHWATRLTDREVRFWLGSLHPEGSRAFSKPRRRRWLIAGAVAIAATIVGLGSSPASADSSQLTDACLNGHTTVITGAACAPGAPSAARVCATGQAHLVLAADYCPAPKVVTVGEYELGTVYVPHLADSTRLDVAMARTSVQSMRYRCSRLGGALVSSKQFRRYVCRGVDHSRA